MLLAGCGAAGTAATPTGAPSAARPILVVTTMSVLADMIHNVGGEHVKVENIIPIGAGPEDYQPKPQDAQKIAAAQIVFFNGHGAEEWLNSLFTSAGNAGQPRIELSKGLQALDVGSADFKEGNPHFWLSAANGVNYVEQIRAGLSQIDPAGAAIYQANATTYSKTLLALNVELKQEAAQLPEANRKLVTNHDAFPYFAQEYGFTVVGSVLGNPSAEPSAGDVAKLVAAVKAQKVKAIFTESQFSQKLTDAIVNEAGVTVIANLYTDTLGESGSVVTNYVDLLRFDMQTIVTALK